jgi:hypothetical protein
LAAGSGCATQRRSPVASDTWFRTRAGRRYGWEICLVVAVKLALLLVLWFVFIKPWLRPIAPAVSIVRQFYEPAPLPSHHD